MIENKAPINGLSGSIKLGVEACRACDADAVLIALADMPRVTATHIYRLLDYAEGADTILASSDAVRPRPPAMLGKHRPAWLMSLNADRGARELILQEQQTLAPTHTRENRRHRNQQDAARH